MPIIWFVCLFFFFNDTATTEIYTLSLHDALPICQPVPDREQLGDELAGRVAIARVALAAGQGLLVAMAGRLLPLRQRGPVQRVEIPDAALCAGAPVLQEGPAGASVAQPSGGEVLQRHTAAAPDVDCDLPAVGRRACRMRRLVRTGRGGGIVQQRPDVHDVPEVLPVLNPVAGHPRPAQVVVACIGRLGQRVHHGRDRGGEIHRVLSPEAGVRPELDEHCYGPSCACARTARGPTPARSRMSGTPRSKPNAIRCTPRTPGICATCWIVSTHKVMPSSAT